MEEVGRMLLRITANMELPRMMAIWKLIFSSRELGPNNTAISSRYRAHVGRIRFKIYRVGRLSMEICGRRGTKFR